MLELFFLYFAAMIVGLSLLVVTRRNPVHSVLWMLLMFFHIAGLYILLNAELLAAVQIIVYAGAILVLFLFVILLLDLRKEIEFEPFVGGWPVGLALAIALFVSVFFTLRFFPPASPVAAAPGQWVVPSHTVALGARLYTEFLLPFEVVSMILLVAVVGAIVLAKRKRREQT